jgi:hypothetical protein
MQSRSPKEVPNVAVIRGDIPRRIRGLEARRLIDRELHGMVVNAPMPEHHADWWYDLRRGQLRVYGALLRCIDWLINSGAPRATVLRIPELLHWYVLDQLEARDGNDTPKRAA